MLKLVKNWYKRFAVLLLILLVAFVSSASFAPARISISGEGILSLESRVALAVNNPPASEAIEESRVAGIYETDWGYEYVLTGGDSVEVGDKDSVDFKPSIKLNRWGGESFIKIQMAGDIESEVEYELEDGKVKTKYKIKYDDFELEVETEFYPLEPTTVIAKDKEGKDVEFIQNELGGFEFEVILKKKPKTNKIVLDIETQGLKFYYQTPLTQQEIDDGAVRPNNVEGSYAVYHATRGNVHKGKATAEKYKVGKAFHIYRPKITDAEGKWVWGELSLDEQAGTLTTTIPQEFLDTAIYPVNHAAGLTIGYLTKGSSDYGSGNYAYASHTGVTPDNSAGRVTELKIACYTEAYEIKVGVYTDSGDLPDSLIGGSDSAFTPADADGNGFYDAGITGFDIQANTRYWLAFTLSNGSSDIFWDETDVLSPRISLGKSSQPYANWMKSIFPTTALNRFDWIFSIYCTYEEEAAPEAEVAPITWEAGILEVNTAANTAINYFTVTNIGSGDIDIEIKGTDLAGGDDTWDLADNGTPGENVFGLYAGLDDLDDNFDIIIKEDATYNTLVAGLAESATQDWGIKLYMPTSVPDYDGQEMTSIVTLIVSAS